MLLQRSPQDSVDHSCPALQGELGPCSLHSSPEKIRKGEQAFGFRSAKGTINETKLNENIVT